MSRKSIRIVALAFMMSVLMVTPAFAGWSQDSRGWIYQKEDGGTPKNGWEWIDGKCYYFTGEGYILTNTLTPDNYQVDENGAWVVNGVVQTQGGTVASSDNYDPQYPLKGRIEQYFSHASDGRLIWKWNSNDIPRDLNDEVKRVGPNHYAFNCAVRDREPDYFLEFSGLDLAVLAELSGYSKTGLYGENGVDQTKEAQMVANVRNFLNSFDFRNASDYEKAVNIANWIIKADYNTEADQSHFAYGNLVNGYAACDGYTSAASLLATCVGLKSNSLGDFTHAYPVFLVDGIWLSYEPTTKDDYFSIANVYSPGYYGEHNYMQLGEYCYETGYVIPEPSYLTGRFPKLKFGLQYGKPTQFIVFR